MRVIVNDLESSRFGVSFGRLEVTDPDRALLSAVISAADADGVDVISTRVNALNLGVVHDLEDLGFRIMDTLVYYRVKLDPNNFYEGVASYSDDIVSKDAEVYAELAERAFTDYVGHYHSDPRLSNEAADAAYGDWIRRLLSSPANGQIALGALQDGRPSGFIVGKPGESMLNEILLNAVAPGVQGTGVYTKLLKSYLNRATAEGAQEVIVSTHLQNYAVQQVWTKTGLHIYESHHTLHRWS